MSPLRTGMVRTGRGVFDPRTVSGLTLWLRAHDIAQADGSTVAAWNDNSGNGNNFAQATEANKPTYQTAEVNGLPCIRLDGADDFLDGPALSAIKAAGAATQFIVFKCNDTDNNEIFRTAVGDIWRVATAFSFVALQNTDSGGIDQANTVYTASAWSLGTFRHDSGNIINKVGTTENTTASGDTTPLTSATRIGGSVNSLNGDVAEILAYNTAVSEADRSRIETYLIHKYNL